MSQPVTYDGYFVLVDGRTIVHHGLVPSGTDPDLTPWRERFGDNVRVLLTVHRGMDETVARQWLNPDPDALRAELLKIQVEATALRIDLHLPSHSQSPKTTTPLHRLQRALTARRRARALLDAAGDKLQGPLRASVEAVADGDPCDHAFSVGNDEEGLVECWVCGTDLSTFDPAIDRSRSAVPLSKTAKSRVASRESREFDT